MVNRSPGQIIYEARQARVTWSEAVALTGLPLADGLRAARAYADEQGLPWPISYGVQGDVPYGFKTTRDLRALVAATFVVDWKANYGLDAEATALEMRVFDKLPWGVIAEEIGCEQGTARDLAHRYIANTDSPEWQRYKALTLRAQFHTYTPSLLYEDRLLSGDSWDVVAKRYEVSPPGRAIILAAHYADDFGLPWPIPPTTWEAPDEERTPTRRYFYRGAGLRWWAIARLTGLAPHGEGLTRAIKWRVINSTKDFAKTRDLPWPVPTPWSKSGELPGSGDEVSTGLGIRSGGEGDCT